MRAFLEIVRNELRAVIRSKSLLLLLVFSVGWMLVAPFVFTGDGTDSGLRQMSLHYSLGGVAALLSVALLTAATGAIARERAEHRLALTMVRPIRFFCIALGKISALVGCGAVVLALCAIIEFVRQPDIACRHVLKPVMPSVRQEAEELYREYMASSNTPVQVKRAKKEVVLRLLANRARDRFDTIPTNSTWMWKFDFDPAKTPALARVTARFRFSTNFDQREDVRGTLNIGGFSGAVSNITQAVVEIPLLRTGTSVLSDGLVFGNEGRSQLMLRPRRDVELLIAADGFGPNLFRVYLELVSMLALLVSLGVFLGSALGRPVALFTAIVGLLLSEMAPSVIDQYADELETDRVDAIGLAITRATASVTQPVSSLRPLEALSLDECIESDEVVRVMTVDFIVLPLLLAFLSALIMPRKQEF